MATFRLKDYLCSEPNRSAPFNLGGSYIEPFTLTELADISPSLQEQLMTTSMAYTETYGAWYIREMLSARYQASADDVILTEGADGALNAVFKALCKKEHKIIVQSPNYEPLQQVPTELGAQVLPWRSTEQHLWRPDLNELESLLSQHIVSAVVVNIPHNPTGFMPDEAFCDRLIALCDQYNALLISDEIYLGLPTDRPFTPMAARYTNAISVSGFSKAYGMPALRIGWLATRNKTLLASIQQKSAFGNAFMSGLSETVAKHVLQNETAVLSRNNSIRQWGEKLLTEFIHKHNHIFSWEKGSGGVTGFIAVHHAKGAAQFAQQCLTDAGVLLVPSEMFNFADSHIRIGFGHKSLNTSLAQLDTYLTETYAG